MIKRIVAAFLVILGICLAVEYTISGGDLPASVSILDESGLATAHDGDQITLVSGDVAVAKIVTQFPGIGGTAALSVTVEGGDVYLYANGDRKTLPANEPPRKIILHSGGDSTASAMIVPLDESAIISDIHVTSISRHQTVWPTRLGILSALMLFLSVALAIGFVPAGPQRRNLALGASVTFIGTLSLSLLLIVSAIVALGFLVAAALSNRKLTYYAALGVLVIPLVVFKIIGPMALAGFELTIQTIWLPIGLSYLIARQIDLAMKIATGQQSRPPIIDYVAYSIFWPSFAAGPITQYETSFLHGNPAIKWDERALAGRRISAGIAKKVLADFVFLTLVTVNYHDVVVSGDAAPETRLAFYFGNMLFVFFDFSGYTDIALGTARLMGIRLPENFDNPLLRWNMREFWRHWHMSLTQWVNRIVYMPLSMAVRRQHHVIKYYVPIIATTMTIGLWHGFVVGWFFWALHHALGVIIADRWIKLDNRLFATGTRPLTRRAFRAAGIGFVWYWLMLSYTFTLSSNATISFREYALVLAAPFQIIAGLIGA